MKPTKTLLRYVWLFDNESPDCITYCLFGEPSDFGILGNALFIGGLFLSVCFGAADDLKIVSAVLFILAIVGLIIIIIDAINRVRAGKARAKSRIENATFEINVEEDKI